jgi:Zn-dependent M28 family amino/carboxypeptidase
MIIMAREDAKRCLRTLQNDGSLSLGIKIDVSKGEPYKSYNVIGEIEGSERPEEVVIIGAHLDSWGLGTGANDNGCNVAMMIDIARQMIKLDIKPKRTIRFALWNGEELGLYGSMAYTDKNESQLGNHIMAMSVDIGSGQITGFFTGGRPDILEATNKVIGEITELGPFTNIDIPLVGTDNFDFMMHGVGNLIGNHDPANYAPNYHAESDTYDKVDLKSLKINSAIVAAVTLGFANDLSLSLPRQSRKEIEELVKSTDLEQQMRSMMGIWDQWKEGKRGRQ